MNEEEIINNIDKIIENCNNWIDEEEFGDAYDKEWWEFEKKSILCLLDLYNKQKERVKQLEEIEQEHRKENGKLREELHNKFNFKYTPQWVDDNYISKDKIKEFIKQETKEGTYNFQTISAKKLLELLEE